MTLQTLRHLTDNALVVKLLGALLAAAVAVAAAAFVFDSVFLLVGGIALLMAFATGVFGIGYGAARRGNFVVPFLLVLGAALGGSALGVAAIVLGERGDAPGMIVLGIAVIVSAIVTTLVLGMRTTQR